MQSTKIMVIKKTTQKIAKKYANDFVKYLEKEHKLSIAQAYLYGSYAKNRQRDWSDIDVAIVSKNFNDRIDPLDYLFSRRRDIDVDRGIEPVGFHPKNFVLESPLVWEIKTTGIKMH